MKKAIFILAICLIFIAGCQQKGGEPKTSEIQKADGPKLAETQEGLINNDKATARKFAEQVFMLIKNRDFSKVYDLLTEDDIASISRTDYVKRATEGYANITTLSVEIKEVLEEPNGVSVQYVENYRNLLGDGSQTGLLKLLKKDGKWQLSIGAVDVKNAIIKGVGDEIVLATIKFKINSVQEQQAISNSYSSTPAKEGTKFVVVDLSITNLNKEKMLFPDEAFILTDNQDRKFETYGDTITSIDNYLNMKELSPSIPEKGIIVFELPNDATSYSIFFAKAGTEEVYKVVLK